MKPPAFRVDSAGMPSPLLPADDLDTRREAWHLLHRLPPARRLAFLWWVCRAATRPGLNCPEPVPAMREHARQAYRCDRADERFTNMVWVDVTAVCNQYEVPFLTAAV